LPNDQIWQKKHQFICSLLKKKKLCQQTRLAMQDFLRKNWKRMQEMNVFVITDAKANQQGIKIGINKQV
jgi:hypothetical protein